MDELLRMEAPIGFYQGIPLYYEDNHLLIAQKPANMPAQADASGDLDVLTRLKRYVGERYQKPGAVYLGLVHRLDRPVAGLMVFARTSKAAARLSAQVREKSLSRQYLAVVRGDAPEEGTLIDYLRKDPSNNTSAVVAPEAEGAKRAELSFQKMGKKEDTSLLLIRLATGRSHQIRVQFANAGLPLWGDARYGGGQPGQPIALFGAGLSLQHPTKPLRIVAFAQPPWEQLPWDGYAEAWAGAQSAMEGFL